MEKTESRLISDTIFRIKYDEPETERTYHTAKQKWLAFQEWMKSSAGGHKFRSPGDLQASQASPSGIWGVPGPATSTKAPATEGEKQRESESAMIRLGRSFATTVGSELRRDFSFLKGFVMGTLIGPALQALGDILKPLWVPVQNFFLTLVMALRPFVDKIVPAVQNFFLNLSMKYGPALAKWAEDMGTKIANWINTHGPQIEDFFVQVGKSLMWLWRNVLVPIGKGVAWLAKEFMRMPDWLKAVTIGAIALAIAFTWMPGWLKVVTIGAIALAKAFMWMPGWLKAVTIGAIALAAYAYAPSILGKTWLGKAMGGTTGSYAQMTPEQEAQAARNRATINARSGKMSPSSAGTSSLDTSTGAWLATAGNAFDQGVMVSNPESTKLMREQASLMRDGFGAVVQTLKTSTDERLPMPSFLNLGVA